VTSVHDSLERPLRDLRISVTDRCDFRCVYCMPKQIFGPNFEFMRRAQLLTFEEITQLARIFAGLGVRKLRLTGGEPLLRRDIERLVAMLREIDGIEDIALTTNGSLLARKAQSLADAGLDRVTVSLDSIDDQVFRSMNDVDFPVEKVLVAIEAASAAGLGPVKVNAVVKRGLNDEGVVEMAEYFRGTGHILRMIEFMDVGNTNGWEMKDVVPAAELIETISEHWELEPLDALYPGEVARRYRYTDGGGEIGVIASVTQPFCGGCTRARLSAEGRLYTCLFGALGHDLRKLVRAEATDAELADRIGGIWTRRKDRYSELRSRETATSRKVEMSHIGG
jgi:GTP 3',8-cyclase